MAKNRNACTLVSILLLKQLCHFIYLSNKFKIKKAVSQQLFKIVPPFATQSSQLAAHSLFMRG